MKDLMKNIFSMAKDDEAYGEKFFISIAIIILCFLLMKLIRQIAKKVTRKEKVRYRIKKAGSFVVVILGIAGVFYTWFNALEGLMAAFSIILAISIFALKDLVLNIAGFAYISIRHPFAIGDRIEINGITGDVVDVGVLQFSVAECGNWLESTDHTGREIFIPNQDVMTNPMANFSQNFPYLWRDIVVPINHNANIDKMIDILETIGKDMLFGLVHKDQADDDAKEALEELGNEVQLFDGNVLPKVHIRADDSGVYCILRYLTPYRGVVKYETMIWKRIIEEVEKNDDLDFSPKSYRIYTSEPTSKYI